MTLPQVVECRSGVALEIAQRTNIFLQPNHAPIHFKLKCLTNSRADSSQDHLPAAIRENCNPCPHVSIQQEENNYG
jgi:hypothetical protein